MGRGEGRQDGYYAVEDCPTSHPVRDVQWLLMLVKNLLIVIYKTVPNTVLYICMCLCMYLYMIESVLNLLRCAITMYIK